MEHEAYPQKARYVEKKRIRLLSGMFRGEIRLYAVAYADELISNRRAVEAGNDAVNLDGRTANVQS